MITVGDHVAKIRAEVGNPGGAAYIAAPHLGAAAITAAKPRHRPRAEKTAGHLEREIAELEQAWRLMKTDGLALTEN